MLVLWSLAKSASAFEAFHQADCFAVHVLQASQQAIARQFAAREGGRFDGMNCQTGHGGIPLLPEYAARFECDTEHRYEGGDHIILVGRVASFDCNESAPLLFYAGRYAATVNPITTNEI